MNKKLKTILMSLTLMTAIFSGIVGCSKSEEKTDASKQTKPSTVEQGIETSDLKQKLNDKNWVIVDTRINDAYNGWKLDGINRGGHIEGAVDFSANWLSVDVENKEEILKEALKTKEITPDKNIVLYDANGKDSKAVKEYLEKNNYKNIYTYDVKEWAKDENLPMVKYKNYFKIVPASIVKDVLEGKKPESFENAKNIKIIEASWGEEKNSYLKGHVPTSVHVNTDTIEPPPAWMLASDKELQKFATDYGFNVNDTVIVTGEASMASYRVASVLRYMGISDVRVLNGGLAAWKSAGYEVETSSNKPVASKDFGAVIPANPNVIDTIAEAKELLKNPNEATLVDNRTWDEHIGKISGYSYYEKKGRVPGSVFAYAGKTDSNSLDYYRNIDNTMRNSDEILKMWKDCGIDTSKHLSFMCGSGWRVAEVYTYADVMGIEKISIFSDGWIGWSSHPENPTETGEPKK